MYTRRPQSPSSVADPIGLAAELLRPESIVRAIGRLDRATLRVLAAHDWTLSSEITDRLTRLGLVGTEIARADANTTNTTNTTDTPATALGLPEIDVTLRAALTAAGIDVDALCHETPGTHPHPEPADTASTPPAGAWFTPALTSVAEAAEVLRALQRESLRLNRSGAVGVSATRELAERTAISVEAVSHALRQLNRAGLTQVAGPRLVTSAEAAPWLALPHQDRWLVLARAFLTVLPAPLRDSLATDAPASFAAHLGLAGEELTDRFPLLSEAELALAREFVSDAERLGCTAHGQFTLLALRLLADEPVTVADVTAELPAAATGVYLQPDLTVLAPGPLAPAAETSLAELSRPEQIGPASMRRITEATLAAAFERGVTPDTARATLEQLSMTGVPQPLDYLLSSLADRIGRIVVQEHTGAEGRSRVHINERSLAETAIVDRQLQHLQLTRAADAAMPPKPDTEPVVLYSRLRAEHVVTAFNEARYHASLGSDPLPNDARIRDGRSDTPRSSGNNSDDISNDRATQHVSEPDVASAKTSQPEAVGDPIEALIERVFVAARTEPEAAAHTRRLELAIRDKAAVSVTAEARGQRRTFTLMPVALTDGRLRATDVAAGVERTLPVSMIVSVDPA